jgi:hypothetical protein
MDKEKKYLNLKESYSAWVLLDAAFPNPHSFRVFKKKKNKLIYAQSRNELVKKFNQ